LCLHFFSYFTCNKNSSWKPPLKILRTCMDLNFFCRDRSTDPVFSACGDAVVAVVPSVVAAKAVKLPWIFFPRSPFIIHRASVSYLRCNFTSFSAQLSFSFKVNFIMDSIANEKKRVFPVKSLILLPLRRPLSLSLSFSLSLSLSLGRGHFSVRCPISPYLLQQQQQRCRIDSIPEAVIMFMVSIKEMHLLKCCCILLLLRF